MTLFGPGIREENEHFIQAIKRNLLLQYRDRVVTDDAHIGEPALLNPHEQSSHARAVDFDAEVVALRMRCCQRRQMIAIAEADFDNAWRPPAEEGVKVEDLRLEVDA